MKTTSRILQLFCYDYFEDLLARITFAKNFGFLAGLVSKYSQLKMHYNQKLNFCVMHLEKVIYYVTLPEMELIRIFSTSKFQNVRRLTSF